MTPDPAADERRRVVAWLREEAITERALADRSLRRNSRVRTTISDRVRMKALGYEEAADAIERQDHHR